MVYKVERVETKVVRKIRRAGDGRVVCETKKERNSKGQLVDVDGDAITDEVEARTLVLVADPDDGPGDVVTFNTTNLELARQFPEGQKVELTIKPAK